MSLLDRINKDLTDAMRLRDQARLGTLRMLKAALVNRGVEKGRDLDEGEEQQVVRSLVKQRRESIEQFERGGRQDLVNKESAEIPVLEAYLPAAADPAEVEAIVDAAIAEAGASSVKDMGRVMKTAMAKLAGKNVDGKAVNELVRRKLGG